MENTKTILSIFTLSAFTILLGCETKLEKETIGPILLGKWKNYIYFEPGSWWIYKLDSGGYQYYDTVKMVMGGCHVNEYNGIVSSTIDRTIIREEFLMNMSSSYFEYVSHGIWPVMAINLTDTAWYRSYRMVRNTPSGETNAWFRPNSTLIPNDVYGLSISTTFKGIHDTIQLSGTMYQNVAEYEISSDGSWKFPGRGGKVSYYYAKGIGLVERKNFGNGETWTLIDYKVETQD